MDQHLLCPLICDAWAKKTICIYRAGLDLMKPVSWSQRDLSPLSLYVSQLALVHRVPRWCLIFHSAHKKSLLLNRCYHQNKKWVLPRNLEKLFQRPSCLYEWALYGMGWVLHFLFAASYSISKRGKKYNRKWL